MAAQGTVGIVGVGNMGGGMAGRLLECGWRVQVRDLVDSKVQALVREGARAAASPREAAAGAQALIVAVVDAQQAAGHAASHVAHADDRDGARHRQLCTRRLALAIDIRMPRPMPSVTIAVPP